MEPAHGLGSFHLPSCLSGLTSKQIPNFWAREAGWRDGNWHSQALLWARIYVWFKWKNPLAHALGMLNEPGPEILVC